MPRPSSRSRLVVTMSGCVLMTQGEGEGGDAICVSSTTCFYLQQGGANDMYCINDHALQQLGPSSCHPGTDDGTMSVGQLRA
jgi:hypothetical protein